MTDHDRPRQPPGNDQQPRRHPHRIVEHSVHEDVKRELDFHLEMSRGELRAAGWSVADAQAEAVRRLGDRRALERSCRNLERRRRTQLRRADMFDVLRQDLRYTFRQLLARPAFTVAALLTLTLGVGAVSTMYTLIQGVLLQELPYPEADRVVNLWEQNERSADVRVSRPNLDDWSEQNRSFSAIAHYSGWGDDVPVVTARGAVTARSTEVSREFFHVLGTDPSLGRQFSLDEQSPGGPPAVIVSDRFWRSQLGASDSTESATLGDVTVRFQGTTIPVIGVMPATFDFPPGTDIWAAAERTRDDSARSAHNWSVVARLGDGVTLESARDDMNAIAKRLRATHGKDTDTEVVTTRPIKAELVGSTRRPLLFLFGASALVLLLAATNLASGLLARAIEREEEITLRGALGAGAGRLMRQLLTETVVLTTLGGLLGTAFAYGALQLLQHMDTRIPRLDEVSVDASVLLVTLAISALTGLIFGLVPALRAARIDIRGALSASRSGGTSKQRVWNIMVGTEVALALVLLIGSMMLVSELWRLLSRPTGFQTEQIAVVDLTVPDLETPTEFDPAVYARVENQIALFHQSFSAQLASLPGVADLAYASYLPLQGGNPNGQICLVPVDCSNDEDKQAYPGYRLVSPGYFRVMSIPVLSGRAFLDSDTADSPFVAVINRTLAERYFPRGDALGQQVLSGGMDLHGAVPTTIVGVVGDVLHRRLDEDPVPEIFYPTQQRALRTRSASYVLRAESGSLEALLGTLRSFVSVEYPELPPDVVTLESIRTASVNDRRFALIVLSCLALVALGLAITGIWAVVTYRVSQRHREIGVRIALGLAPPGVFRLILGETARVLAIGTVAGTLLALAATRVLRAQIGGLEGSVPVFLCAIFVLTSAGFLASWLPARRATAIEPVIAMRSA